MAMIGARIAALGDAGCAISTSSILLERDRIVGSLVARVSDATLFDPCSLDAGRMHRSRAIRRPHIRYL